MKIGFIGGGNMAEAIVSSLLQKKRAIPGAVTVADISPERRNYLTRTYGVTATADNTEAILGSDVIVLAVKPQQMPMVLAEMKGLLADTQLIISIAAGIRIISITEALGHTGVVRAMPNMPARAGQGITGWTATPKVTDMQKDRARGILGSMGKEIYFDNEADLDKVTAVSGSGPAYVFYFLECFINAGVRIGLSPEAAEELAKETLYGTVHFLESSGNTPAELRAAVTSKGGTTERALEVLQEGGFSRLIGDAVKAALKRAGELGK